MAFGPGESRFVEEKRHFEKPIPVNDVVFLDRERCILCDRCTRFADEVAGDTLIHFQGRGAHTEVNTFPDEPFSSYFSGNTVQLCPVGALTAAPYRFKARPWDLEEVESTSVVDSVGSRSASRASTPTPSTGAGSPTRSASPSRPTTTRTACPGHCCVGTTASWPPPAGAPPSMPWPTPSTASTRTG
jgi:predicted molibdopterin-dependent oxidoreductase YjgC